MNLTEIFEMQAALDQSIMEAHKVAKRDVRTKRIVALLVEISEFANEYAPFKYWKKNKKINMDFVLEEFVDGIHFLTSLALEVKLDPNIKAIIQSENQTEQLAATFEAVIALNTDFTKEKLLLAYGLYLGNAQLLKISEKQVLKHYIAKNKINYQRILNNY